MVPIHDQDGNATSYPLPIDPTNNASLTYDAENRLISVTTGTTTVTYTYDSRSRRVARTQGSNVNLYLYDAWNCLAEYSLQNSSFNLHTSLSWGLDLSGSLQGAGGVGGLLSVTKHQAQSTTHFFPTYDGNGNVSEYLDATGSTAAHYEYDPFGRTIDASGSQAAEFAYRFSTKPVDPVTGLYYYGYRWYDPNTGRWVTRDPIEERGGMNLYGFVVGDSINELDIHGLTSRKLIISSVTFKSATAGDPTSLTLLGEQRNKKTGIVEQVYETDANGNLVFKRRYVDEKERQLASLREVIEKCPQVLMEGGIIEDAEGFPKISVEEVANNSIFDDSGAIGPIDVGNREKMFNVAKRALSFWPQHSKAEIRVIYLRRDLLGSREARGVHIRDEAENHLILLDMASVGKYTLAHEIGHVLGCRYPGQDPIHYQGEDETNLMRAPSPEVDAKPDCQWCIRLRDFLDQK